MVGLPQSMENVQEEEAVPRLVLVEPRGQRTVEASTLILPRTNGGSGSESLDNSPLRKGVQRIRDDEYIGESQVSRPDQMYELIFRRVL